MDSFKDYQEQAAATAVYQEAINNLEAEELKRLLRVAYTSLGLAGEAGELANKVKKLLRGDAHTINFFSRADLALGLGDVLWYIAAMAGELGYTMADVAKLNIDKLADRKERDAIKGAGDER